MRINIKTFYIDQTLMHMSLNYSKVFYIILNSIIVTKDIKEMMILSSISYKKLTFLACNYTCYHFSSYNCL